MCCDYFLLTRLALDVISMKMFHRENHQITKLMIPSAIFVHLTAHQNITKEYLNIWENFLLNVLKI